jgi:uncharacterized protein (DUF2147 family)
MVNSWNVSAIGAIALRGSALMKHRSFGPTLSVLAAALFAACGSPEASAADPSGIWVKDDGSAKVEIKKCGRGICGEVVWLRDPKDSQAKPLRDVRNEDPSLRDRPIIGLPVFSKMRLTEPDTWAGNVYNPVDGHIYTDVKVTLVSRQQIVLRGCKTWLLCGEKIWTRSYLPPSPASPPRLIEVKAPAESGSTDKAEPRSAPKPEAPLVETLRAREPRSAPGFTLVRTAARWEPVPLTGGNVSSMIAMTKPSPVATAAEPRMIEAAGAEEQWPWLERSRTGARAETAPTAPRFGKPGPKPVVREAQEQLPWLQHRSRTQARAETAPAAPGFGTPEPKPVVREAEEQWPWLQRRSTLLASARTGG